MRIVKILQFLAIVAYASYLINVGLLLVMLPWSQVWGILMLKLPPAAAFILDAPATRGCISSFGTLHLLLLVVELLRPTVGDKAFLQHQATHRS